MLNKILPEIINKTSEAKGVDCILDVIADSIHSYTEFENVGIRIESDEDYPYRKTLGFSESFIKKESSLLSKDENGNILRDSNGCAFLECMCGNVIQKRFDPSFPFFTERGSFWSNSTTQLLASTTEKDRQARTRNYCNAVGFESVGIFPLNLGSRNLGAIHITDKRPGMFTGQKIEVLELVAAYVANLIYPFLTVVNALQKDKRALEERIKYLEKMNKFMTGREYRIIELKERVRDLEDSLKLEKRLREK